MHQKTYFLILTVLLFYWLCHLFVRRGWVIGLKMTIVLLWKPWRLCCLNKDSLMHELDDHQFWPSVNVKKSAQIWFCRREQNHNWIIKLNHNYNNRENVLANFRFNVKWHTTGKVQYLVLSSFLLILTKVSFWEELSPNSVQLWNFAKIG